MISALLVLSSLIIAIMALVFTYDAVMIGEMFIAGAGGLMGPCFFSLAYDSIPARYVAMSLGIIESAQMLGDSWCTYVGSLTQMHVQVGMRIIATICICPVPALLLYVRKNPHGRWHYGSCYRRSYEVGKPTRLPRGSRPEDAGSNCCTWRSYSERGRVCVAVWGVT